MQWRLLWTLLQALITCTLVLLSGVPVAWALARLDFRGRRLVLRLLMLPFVMPTLVAGMGVLALFGPRGALWPGWQDTPYLLLYGNVFFNLPVLVRAAYQGFLQVPAGRLQAAQNAGRGRVAALLACGMAGIAAVAGRRRVFGVSLLLLRLRAGALARRQPLCHGGSGNLPINRL